MNPSPLLGRIPGRGLLAAAAVLAAAGCVLVTLGLSDGPEAAPSGPASPVARTGSASPAAPTARAARPTRTPTASKTSPPPVAGELPPPGSGPRADPIVQRALDQAIPPDLPPAASRRLTALGRALWIAEVTGTGRQQWHHYFTNASAVPSAAYTRVRIQAAIARRDSTRPGATNAAVVHVVWAGADLSGSYLDGRSATVRFTLEGDSWNPVR